MPRLGIVECHVAIGHDRHRGNARVRMQRHASRQAAHIGLEQVEEHERLQPLSEVGRAHQANNRTVFVAPGLLNDSAHCRWLLPYFSNAES